MQFTTQIPIPKSNHPVDYNSQIVSLGSCFAVNMGQKFDYFKFRNTTNPFGILFSPAALEKFIGFAVNKKVFTGADIFYHNGRWHCYDAHSDVSHPEKEMLLSALTNAASYTFTALEQASHVIITLGTAWVYRHLESGALVANCHKVPQKEFTKELLSAEAIKTCLLNILKLIKGINPDVQVIVTISPVRHIKDGFIENQWSKANLISAAHQILHSDNSKLSARYFPSYEIMMDELRDYRFYAQDMIHPNTTAIDYIWERFTQAYITADAQETMKLADSIQKGLQHRPFNPETAQHMNFTSKLQDKIILLRQRYPHIVF
jgi:hypothetical protein